LTPAPSPGRPLDHPLPPPNCLLLPTMPFWAVTQILARGWERALCPGPQLVALSSLSQPRAKAPPQTFYSEWWSGLCPDEVSTTSGAS
jgi:hypothetical protein